MTKQKSKKRALLMSALSLLMCVSMLVGTTFAWFTDSVTSGGNIIKSGHLDIALEWAEGSDDPAAASWKDASNGAIFNSNLWEPGFVQARHLKVKNDGNLAFKWQMRILANGIVTELADVIDVYYYDTAVALTRQSLSDANKLGTLSQVLNNTLDNAISAKVVGTLKAGESQSITIALKMQETASNEYQDLEIGTDFSVQLIATQLTAEFDSFDNTYDKDADFAPQETPSAMVKRLTKLTYPVNGTETTLDAAFQFEPTETAEQGAASEWANAHADFYVYADKNVAAKSLMLAGYYSLYCDNYAGGSWLGLTSDAAIEANQGLRLIADGMNGGETLTGITVPYNAICALGNDGIGFRCGLKDVDGSNAGTTITVELRLYKTLTEEEAMEQHGIKTTNYETGEYITIGTFSYVIGGEYFADEYGAEYFEAFDGSVSLASAKNVTAETYTILDGTVSVDGFAFSGNTATKKVVFADSIKTLGQKILKDSAVETVVLNEGLTTIGEYAFNAAKKLKSYNIPSTVSTLEQYAFAQTAATEVVIPENVSSIGYAAFTAMPNLASVTIEGKNVDIANYAFRDCPNLRKVTILSDDITIGNNMPFTNGQSNNPGTNDITFYVENTVVAAKIKAAMGTGTNFYIYVKGEDGYAEATVVSNANELKNAIQNASATEENVIVLADGTYTGNIDITLAAVGSQKGDLVFKAAGENAVIAGTVTLGLYENGTFNDAKWDGNVTFEGITFDHAQAANHSLNVQSVKKLTLKDCKIIGDGEYGIGSAAGGNSGPSLITGCTFEDASMQITGNFGSGLVIDDCEFNNSRVNVQGGNGVTVQNCDFNAALTDANVDDSFYCVRSNDIPITVTGCEINVDSTVTGVAAGQSKWVVLWNRGATKAWTITDVAVTLTDAALQQTELLVVKTAGGAMNTTNLTVNGAAQ